MRSVTSHDVGIGVREEQKCPLPFSLSGTFKDLLQAPCEAIRKHRAATLSSHSGRPRQRRCCFWGGPGEELCEWQLPSTLEGAGPGGAQSATGWATRERDPVGITPSWAYPAAPLDGRRSSRAGGVMLPRPWLRLLSKVAPLAPTRLTLRTVPQQEPVQGAADKRWPHLSFPPDSLHSHFLLLPLVTSWFLAYAGPCSVVISLSDHH